MATKPRKKPKPQPRQAKGKFSTSKAKKKRVAKGFKRAPKSIAHAIGGHASDISRIIPGISGEPLRLVATASALMPGIKTQAVATLQSAEQKVIARLRQRLIESSPGSVDYLEKVVNGDYDAAPHSVRAQAALGIIDRAIQITQANPEAKDQAEMSLEELQRLGSQIHHQLASANAEDAEIVPEVGNAALLRPETSLD